MKVDNWYWGISPDSGGVGSSLSVGINFPGECLTGNQEGQACTGNPGQMKNQVRFKHMELH